MASETGSWPNIIKIPLTVIVTVLLVVFLSNRLPAILFPFLVSEESFAGGYPSVENHKSYRTVHLHVPAGVRTNWHTHSDGQLLMVETGVARTQVRGQPMQDIGPGSPWWTAPGIEHWHGAVPDQDVLQLTIYSGDVDWLEPVSDEEYHAGHEHEHD